MNFHFGNYHWKVGKPYGKNKVDPTHPLSYKIVSDPYYKRICIEKYEFGKFLKNIYDSVFLDFRHLRLADQAVWQREILLEESNLRRCLLRNQDDRAILMETLCFESDLCRSCLIHSIHGIHLSTHQMFYKSLLDPFDGVILYDQEKRPVMQKIYTLDSFTGEFDELISEQWNMEIDRQDDAKN